MTLNSDRFLNAFSTIEQHLRAVLRVSKGQVGFPRLVEAALEQEIETVSGIDPGVAEFKYDLLQFAKLRNAIVHERPDGRVIAEPNDWAVARIERIAGLLLKPPKVIPLFKADVLMLPVNASAGDAVQFMNKYSYSQIPVHDGSKFVALLSANTIARWLGARYSNSPIDLSEHSLVDVIRYSETQDNYRFLGVDSTVFEVLRLFDDYELTGGDLDAILITETGEPAVQFLGIVTSWDVPRAHKAIQLRDKLPPAASYE